MKKSSASIILAKASMQVPMLHELRCLLASRGIAFDQLPNDVTLQAFALLGDHDRHTLLKKLTPRTLMLQARGVLRGDLEEQHTPHLRLLSHAMSFLDAMEDIWTRMLYPKILKIDDVGLIRIPDRVVGHLGQKVQHLHFEILEHCDHLMIIPDEIFGLSPSLLAAEDTSLCGQIEFPIDDGAIEFRLLDRQGVVHSRKLRIEVLKDIEE